MEILNELKRLQLSCMRFSSLGISIGVLCVCVSGAGAEQEPHSLPRASQDDTGCAYWATLVAGCFGRHRVHELNAQFVARACADDESGSSSSASSVPPVRFLQFGSSSSVPPVRFPPIPIALPDKVLDGLYPAAQPAAKPARRDRAPATPKVASFVKFGSTSSVRQVRFLQFDKVGSSSSTSSVPPARQVRCTGQIMRPVCV